MKKLLVILIFSFFTWDNVYADHIKKHYIKVECDARVDWHSGSYDLGKIEIIFDSDTIYSQWLNMSKVIPFDNLARIRHYDFKEVLKRYTSGSKQENITDFRKKFHPVNFTDFPRSFKNNSTSDGYINGRTEKKESLQIELFLNRFEGSGKMVLTMDEDKRYKFFAAQYWDGSRKIEFQTYNIENCDAKEKKF